MHAIICGLLLADWGLRRRVSLCAPLGIGLNIQIISLMTNTQLNIAGFCSPCLVYVVGIQYDELFGDLQLK